MLTVKTFSVFLFSLIVLSIGCNADGNNSNNLSGGEIYQSQCAACHGQDGGAVLGERSLQESDLSKDEIERITREGEGQMPSFGDILSDEELEAVAEYTKGLQE
ncbi:cytochrome c [Cytophagaceae bacterium ABcell3]|nr:cytochrome c [Cytophagaceae bacterium ABcell3]